MKRTLKKFIIYFVSFFIIILVYGAIFKPTDLEADGVVRALIISLGSSFGIVLGGRIIDKNIARK